MKLCTGIAVLPIRNPLANAHQLASIDLISNGRLVYGVGVGWLKEEADALGMPWDRRGKRSDEIIALLRTLWTATGETVEFHGEFYDVPPIDIQPLPVQRPIPILVGGHSDVALDRVARLGDGWIAAGLGQSRYPEAFERLQRACEKHGRDVGELEIVNGEHTDVLLDAGDPDMAAQVERALGGPRRLRGARSHSHEGVDSGRDRCRHARDGRRVRPRGAARIPALTSGIVVSGRAGGTGGKRRSGADVAAPARAL